jgi:hypothetical protein
MTFIIAMQLLEMQLPGFVVQIELESNLVEPLFSFLIHFASFEAFTLSVDPSAQWRVFLELDWHISCNSGTEISGVLVGVFKMKIKRLIAQNNSQ